MIFKSNEMLWTGHRANDKKYRISCFLIKRKKSDKQAQKLVQVDALDLSL